MNILPTTKPTINTPLSAVLERAPQLTAFGFGLHWLRRRELSKEEWQREFAGQRQRLAESGAAFARCCDWISRNLERQKTISYKRSSYGLKHIAEREIGYITNGTFIAAMIACGYRWVPDGPNAYFSVTWQSVRNAEQRVECSTSIGDVAHQCARSKN